MPDSKELLQIEGSVEDIIYQSEDTGYTVCEIDSDDGPVTLVGTMPSLVVGDAVRAMGSWTVHPTYGKQFKVTYFEKSMPADETAMLRYLASRAVHGIGPKLAQRIVSVFHEETFDVIENHPEMLADVPGISLKKALAVSEDFREQFGVRNIMMFFSGFFGPATSVRIYKRWGNAAVDIVKNNPYLLCDEIYGVGFEKADSMASALGLENDSPERVQAGLSYVLRFNAQANGHCYLPREKLITTASQLLETAPERVERELQNLCDTGKLSLRDDGGKTAVYLPEFFNAEVTSAKKLVELSRINLYGSISGTEDLIRQTEKEQGFSYAPLQLEAIRYAIENPVTVLTGGPGTGKTTIVKAIVHIFEKVGMRFALAAPTGRAAKRMSESTGYDAKTLHRLLEMEYSPDEKMRFVRNASNPLDFDVVIADEVSMVDISLFSALLQAIKPGTRLVLIGDSDQLPSVGAGDVLADTIKSGVFKVCRLNEIFRQSGQSDIIHNAHRINRGEYPAVSGKDGDFFLMARPSARLAAETVVELCRDRLPRRYGDQISEGIQVITCTRKGELGTVNLNRLLQESLNPYSSRKNEKKFRDCIFREGDKVMQIRNNYDLEWTFEDDEDHGGIGIFNGDIGRICTIDEEEEALCVNYDGKLCTYRFDELEEIEHAYAVTVHKSQGSEYPVVIFPVFNPPPLLATRNLIYTGITRAQKMVILVGDQQSVCKMVDNNCIAARYTGLASLYKLFSQS